MFDEKMRTIKDAIFDPLAYSLQICPPWLLTFVGLIIGIVAALALWQQFYLIGFLLWFLNRVFDGLDGAVARKCGSQNDFGGYLDTLTDHVVYAAIPVGLALSIDSPLAIPALIFLLCTFYINAASWMYLASILEKRNRGNKQLTTIKMPIGLISGTETIIFYTAFMFFPSYLPWLFGLMALLVIVTIGQRLVWAKQHLL